MQHCTAEPADDRTLVDGGNGHSRGFPFMPAVFPYVSALATSPKRLSILTVSFNTTNSSENRLPRTLQGDQHQLKEDAESKPADLCCSCCSPLPGHPSCCNKPNDLSRGKFRRYAVRCLPLEAKRFSEQQTQIFHTASCVNYRTPIGNNCIHDTVSSGSSPVPHTSDTFQATCIFKLISIPIGASSSHA
jgi:hypothetical protein